MQYSVHRMPSRTTSGDKVGGKAAIAALIDFLLSLITKSVAHVIHCCSISLHVISCEVGYVQLHVALKRNKSTRYNVLKQCLFECCATAAGSIPGKFLGVKTL